MSEKIEELRNIRLQKLKKLEALGHSPYPVDSERTHRIGEAHRSFEELSLQKTLLSLCGRIRALRAHGKLVFIDLEDESGKIQVLVKPDVVGEQFSLVDFLDMGDFLEVRGILILSKTGQESLEASNMKILSKSLLPIPTEHFGIEDTEILLRKRHLDLMLNQKTRDLFRKKAVFWGAIRNFLESRDFLEVHLNVLEPIPGGAEAEPFTTHHKALDREFYLRISLELPLKKMVAGGFEKVFEIGRIFRNEGVSTEHLQDYTQMEFYWAYSEYGQLMGLVEEMYKDAIFKVAGSLKTIYDGNEIDWNGRWPKVRYFDIFKEKTGIDLNSAGMEELKKFADRENIKYEKSQGKGRIIDLIYKKKVRPFLIQPCFLINPPVEVEPLAKKDPKNPKEVQRMQVMAGGTELGKGFTELNDPLDQRARFEEQMKLREAGDAEAQMLDEDYLEAMEYGMPPMSGFGLSERLFAVIMDRSVRETTVYPLMKKD
jgi:lysyl-tRNA synthetase, class II